MGKNKKQQLADLLAASYDNSEQARKIGEKYGYTLDTQLSSPEQKVFVNKKGKPLISFRGSTSSSIPQFTRDWLQSDIAILTGREKQDPRFQRSQKLVEAVDKKYGQNAMLIGHSLGGSLARASAGERNKVIAYNPGVGLGGIGKKIRQNETVIRAPLDLVSALAETQKGKVVHTKNYNINPLASHHINRIRQQKSPWEYL